MWTWTGLPGVCESSSKAVQSRAQAGFSLLEVLVAFAILAGSLGVLMQTLSLGMRNAGLAERYAEAASLAQSKLAEIAAEPELEPGEAEGEWEGPFRFRLVVEPYEMELPDPPPPVEPMLISLRVWWQEGAVERDVALHTLRLQPLQGAAMATPPRRAIRR